jgi:hypothetical protein
MTAGFAVFGSTLRRCDGFCVKREPDKPIGQLLEADGPLPGQKHSKTLGWIVGHFGGRPMPNITDEEVTRLVESVEIVQRELTNAVRALNEDQRGSAQDALGAATRQVVTLTAVLQNYQLRGKPPGS